MIYILNQLFLYFLNFYSDISNLINTNLYLFYAQM